MKKEALILDTDQRWASFARNNLERSGMFSGIQFSPQTLADIPGLSQQEWGMVIMEANAAVTDQRRPLEALFKWQVSQKNESPLLVLSLMPSSVQSRDAMGLGATSYDRVPYDSQDLERLVNQTMTLHQRLTMDSQSQLTTQVRREQYLQRFQHLNSSGT